VNCSNAISRSFDYGLERGHEHGESLRRTAEGGEVLILADVKLGNRVRVDTPSSNGIYLSASQSVWASSTVHVAVSGTLATVTSSGSCPLLPGFYYPKPISSSDLIFVFYLNNRMRPHMVNNGVEKPSIQGKSKERHVASYLSQSAESISD
jgi:hypothetical protein